MAKLISRVSPRFRAMGCGRRARTSLRGASSRWAGWVGRHSEVENRAAGLVGSHRQVPVMRFDNRATDRQSHPQTAGLRRVEGVEDAIETFRGQPRARVLHLDENTVWCSLSGGDKHLSGSVRDRTHCLDRIDNQVEDHLLQLDAIALDKW